MERRKLVVIGGGAAGFFCAVNAAAMRPDLEVVLIEKTGKLLSKVKVSGGGRCNVTHAIFDIAEMSRKYPRGYNFLKKSFHQFFTNDTIEWFAARGVKLKVEKDGRMFPVTDSSQTIMDCLLREADRSGVRILLNKEVKNVVPVNNGFTIDFGPEKIKCEFVCVASGGYPKSQSFEWIMQLGHTIEEPAPSLFTFNLPGHPIRELMGVAVERANCKITNSKFEELGPVLITHWGLSGPAVLRLSAWAARQLKASNYEFKIVINWLPDYNEQTLAERIKTVRIELAAQKVTSKNIFGMPSRLWEFLVNHAGIKVGTRWADLSAKDLNKFVSLLCRHEFEVKGKTTFKEEFVTAGGVKLSEVDPNTMMSRKVNGLYFAGEVMDIDGITGGFNFQNAWTTGFIAASHISAGMTTVQ